jgi:hypothetical protein
MEHKLKVIQNEDLKIPGPKAEEVTREWRKLQTNRYIICILHKILTAQMKVYHQMGSTCGTSGGDVK